ncbi:hypothetical protein ACOTHJ_14640 [Achromobacter xylosoxidans]
MTKLMQLLDRAALTLHEGFLTSSLGNRGAVAAFILITAGFPDSLGFCFWLGIGLTIGWAGLSPANFGVTGEQFHALAVTLIFIGVAGLGLNLRRMADRPIVRAAASGQGS